ncbi:MAG: helix-hairpin-helix domain-containing protein, partial [Clostridiales Family XIII bacterium]|nr:helix-hairpin-helix domain-containing protein [Clostridiales Family XIII bacterium]
MNFESMLNMALRHRAILIKALIALVLLICATATYLNKTAGDDAVTVIAGTEEAGPAGSGQDGAAGSVGGDDGAGIVAGNGVGGTGESAGPNTGDDAAGNGTDGGSAAAVSAAQPATIVVDVSGAVNNPSVFILDEGSRVYEALEAAGGPSADADMREINRATVLNDGDRLYIPTKEEIAAGTPTPGTAGIEKKQGLSGTGAQGEAPQPGSGPGGLININTADSKALQQLNGVGPSTAEKIIEYRTLNGAFKQIEDIQNVSGIGAKTFEKLKSKITV